MEALDKEYIFRVTSDGVQDVNGDVDVRFVSTGEKIIRCRDCEYFDNDFSSGWCERLFICDERDGFSVNEDDYCSFGVEKEV